MTPNRVGDRGRGRYSRCPMDQDRPLDVAREQLGRMRGMTALYHKRFFADVRFALVAMIGLLALGFWGVAEAFLIVPFVAVWGAVQTSFDASYLIFARQYAAALERWINRRLGEDILLAGALEDAYLFPLGGSKVVTIPLSGPVTWFGFVTAFTTVGGVFAAVVGIWAGWSVLIDLSPVGTVAYGVMLLTMTVGAVGFGWWWFIRGTGERRLETILASLDRAD